LNTNLGVKTRFATIMIFIPLKIALFGLKLECFCFFKKLTMQELECECKIVLTASLFNDTYIQLAVIPRTV